MPFCKNARLISTASADPHRTPQISYFINEFTAPLTNHRSDEFGGDADGRLRMPVEIVKAVRVRMGADFPITYRISAVDLIAAGTSGEETLRLARRIEFAGADIINIGVRWHESSVPTITHVVPRTGWRYATRAIRQSVDIPVMASNRINDPQVAEELLEAGDADLVAMARPLLADPKFAVKARGGATRKINTCIACNQACLDGYFTKRLVSCLVTRRRVVRSNLRKPVPGASYVSLSLVVAPQAWQPPQTQRSAVTSQHCSRHPGCWVASC